MCKCKLLFIVSLLLIFYSCTNDYKEPVLPQGIIVINPVVTSATRGVDATADMLANGIRIYAQGTDNPQSNYIDGIIFSKDAQSGQLWASKPYAYWPSYALDFYGFYPDSITPVNATIPSVFQCKIDSNAAKQADIVMGYALNQNKELAVPLTFRHALSKVSFVFKSQANSNLDVTVNSVGITNIPLSGTFTYNKNAITIPYFEITNQADVSNATMAFPSALNIASGASTDTLSGLYLIPHTLDNWVYGASTIKTYPMEGSYININGKYSGLTSYTGNIAIPLTTTKWLPGMHYTYSITFGDLTGSTGGGGYNPNAVDPKNSNKPLQLIIKIIIKVVVEPWTKVDETIDI